MNNDYNLLQQELESTWAHALTLQEKIDRLEKRVRLLQAMQQQANSLATYWRERYEQQVSRTERAIKVANMTDAEREAEWEPFYYWCSKCGENDGFCGCDEPHFHKID